MHRSRRGVFAREERDVVERISLRVSSAQEAERLDQLVARFAQDLAQRSEECVFYLTEPGQDGAGRIVETETAETLSRFVALVSPHLRIRPIKTA